MFAALISGIKGVVSGTDNNLRGTLFRKGVGRHGYQCGLCVEGGACYKQTVCDWSSPCLSCPPHAVSGRLVVPMATALLVVPYLPNLEGC